MNEAQALAAALNALRDEATVTATQLAAAAGTEVATAQKFLSEKLI